MKTPSKKKPAAAMVTNLPLIQRVEMDGVDIYPLVVRQVNKSWFGAIGSVEYQDAVGEALLAVSQLRRRFNHSHGVKFSTYAYVRIRGAASDLVRRELTYASRHEPTAAATLIEAAGGADGMESAVSDRLVFLRIMKLVETRLPVKLGRVLVWSFLEERKDREIARGLRCDLAEVPKLREEALREVRRLLLLPQGQPSDDK